jgi:plastocyanin
MKRLGVALLPLVLIGAIAAIGCGKQPGGQTSNSSGNTVSMTTNNFTQQAITIKAGSQLQFTDPSDTGGLHVLCFGHNQTCAPNDKGPAELNDPKGVTFSAGDTKSYTFATPGTFEVTCTIHANMNVTVTVQ